MGNKNPKILHFASLFPAYVAGQLQLIYMLGCVLVGGSRIWQDCDCLVVVCWFILIRLAWCQNGLAMRSHGLVGGASKVVLL
jgi:hypothetical protein